MDMEMMKRIASVEIRPGPDPETVSFGGPFSTSVEAIRVAHGDKAAEEYRHLMAKVLSIDTPDIESNDERIP